MIREPIAAGAHLQAIPGEKFKRFKINLHFILPGERETATALAILPHLLERRCAAVPDPTALSRRLFDLYGAELTGESYTAGANRVVTLGISGLKSGFTLEEEDLEHEALALLLELIFRPALTDGAFDSEDLAIEAGKQADFLRNEMNDKRGYCLRQARRKLYGDSPLGIESAGYLEDIESLTPEMVMEAYNALLRNAALEVVACGVEGGPLAGAVAAELEKLDRAPVAPELMTSAAAPARFAAYTEAMDTVQGKLCILCTGGEVAGAQNGAVVRMASAILGGLPTSRLFQNVREKQSLCYYCTSVYGAFSGTLQLDSGVDHALADKAADAMLHELKALQTGLVSEEELHNARKALANSFAAAGDSPDALAGWAFTEWLRGTNQSLAEASEALEAVTREQIRDALAAYTPALRYTITGKEGA